MKWDLYLNFLVAVLALVNPVSRLPFWRELTGDLHVNIRTKTAFYIVLSGLVILLVFLLTGKPILNFFSIDLRVFKLAGGILLLISGIHMINGQMSSIKSKDEKGSDQERALQRFQKVIVPMAVPLLAGPGSITTVILFGSKAVKFLDYVVLSSILVVNMAVIYFFFTYSDFAEKRINGTIYTVLTRILGIIVTAIGVQFIIEGISDIFPTLDIADGVKKLED